MAYRGRKTIWHGIRNRYLKMIGEWQEFSRSEVLRKQSEWQEKKRDTRRTVIECEPYREIVTYKQNEEAQEQKKGEAESVKKKRISEDKKGGIALLAAGIILSVVAIAGVILVDSDASAICIPVLSCGMLGIFYGIKYLRRES